MLELFHAVLEGGEMQDVCQKTLKITFSRALVLYNLTKHTDCILPPILTFLPGISSSGMTGPSQPVWLHPRAFPAHPEVTAVL